MRLDTSVVPEFVFDIQNLKPRVNPQVEAELRKSGTRGVFKEVYY